MKFKDGKEPNHLGSYLSDRADQERRDDLGKDGKKLTKQQRDKIAKDPKFTDKRKRADEN